MAAAPEVGPGYCESLVLAILSAMRRASTEDELLSEMANEIRDHTLADACDILFRDANEMLVLRASTRNPELTYRLKLGRGVGLCGEVMTNNRPVFIREDAEQNPKYAKYPGQEDVEVSGLAILPLSHESEPAFGCILLRRAVAWDFKPSERKRLTEIGPFVAGCLEGFRSAYQAGTQLNRLGALSEVSKTISTSPYLEEILQLLVNLTAQQFNYRVCTVRLLDEGRGELVLRATQAPAKAYQRKRAIKLGESIAGRAIAENRPVIVPDVQVEADYIGHDLAAEQGLRSMICVPLTIQEKVVGVLSCYTSDVREFTLAEISALETLAKQAAVSIEHAKLQVRHTLMQEMHHRVKNNLQQVASLLRLQMRHGEYKSLEEAMNDCLARILAIASVHDLLSREDLDHVGVRSIAETLVQHQQASFILPDRRIGFRIQGDDVTLSVTQATQVALVLNELLQNALEHGFSNTLEGEVHINVEERDEEIALWVSNSGDALPMEFDPAKASHLGLQIVESLARALGGRFKIGSVLDWTVAEVKFHRISGE